MAARKSIKRRNAPKSEINAGSVFLNIPYDAGFENLLLAYISAISAFGFTPRATLEIPFGQRRLDRILTWFSSRNIRFMIFRVCNLTAHRPELRASTCRLSWD